MIQVGNGADTRSLAGFQFTEAPMPYIKTRDGTDIYVDIDNPINQEN